LFWILCVLTDCVFSQTKIRQGTYDKHFSSQKYIYLWDHNSVVLVSKIISLILQLVGKNWAWFLRNLNIVEFESAVRAGSNSAVFFFDMRTGLKCVELCFPMLCVKICQQLQKLFPAKNDEKMKLKKNKKMSILRNTVFLY